MKKNIAFLIAGAMVCGATMAQTPLDDWKFGYTTEIDTATSAPCNGTQCAKSQPAASQLNKVCLNRTKTGFFSLPAWEVEVAPAKDVQCKEILYVNFATKTFYIEAPFTATNDLNGQPRVSCMPKPEDPKIGSLSHGWCKLGMQGYCEGGYVASSGFDACSSEFFERNDDAHYRVLNRFAVWSAVRESKLVEAVGQFMASEARRTADNEVLAYRDAFEHATTLDAITTFELKYSQNDPEDYIPRLAEPKRLLEIEVYRQRFSSMVSIEQIKSFIADYVYNDPDRKLPEARRRLNEEQRKSAALLKKTADEKAAGDKILVLTELERRIVSCKHEIASAKQVIDRENQIGQVSGYVNKLLLRQAGETIVLCNESIPTRFAEYKRLGGARALANLR